MYKVFLLFFLLLLSLQARENPFFASKGEQDILYTSNKKKFIPSPLNKINIALPNQARIIQNVLITYKNLDGSIETKNVTVEKSIDWHRAITIAQAPIKKFQKQKFQLVAKIPFAKFYIQEKKLKIKTTDKLIRNFLITNPHRIVLDFQRTSHLKSYTKLNKNSVFTKIKVGNHSNYYRVVLELDGYYKYNLNTFKNEILISLQ